jgi:acetylornithine/succinyldiaminopimelate/putrescine aminotransferase
MITQRQLFLNHVAQTSDAPLLLEVHRAKGVYLYDENDRPYLDLIAGISVSNLGHNHPAIVAAIQEQSKQYLHTLVYGEFVLSPQVQLATLLQEHLPDNLNCTYFVNSGAEATEGAMKLAKRYTGRTNIVACKQAYHGSTHGALSLMDDPFFTAPFRPLLPDITHIAFNEEEDLKHITTRTACVVMETVRAEVGVLLPKDNYLQKVKARCEEVGALLVLDEIQVGCGRTGSLFAFEQYGIVPDILLLAKGFGGGMPLGAFVSSKEIMQVLTHNPVLGHITTFGGHPVCCAASLASLKVLTEQPAIIGQVKEKEAMFHGELKHPAIKEIRSAGLLMGVELPSYDFVLAVIKEALANGLVSDWFLFNASAIRIAPPLIITIEEIKKACTILLAAIEKAYQDGIK